MTRSMTAFTRQHAEFPWGALAWEIRSVNHRYLEPSIKLPETLRSIEPKVREMLRTSINRGKVDVQLRLTLNPVSGDDLAIDQRLLHRLIEAEAEVRRQLSGPASSATPAPVNTLELLRWPGVIQEQEQNTKAIEQETLILFQKALDDLQEHREREGQALATIIRQRLDAISLIVSDIRQAMPEILERQKLKLQENLARLVEEGNPERLEQEIVILAQKADIHEEVDRLDTHVREVTRTLGEKGQVGRKLDFLMQELNREANTICSKAVVTETTFGAVELKVLIEQMREQIQNIE